jgi:hypothetical protein
LFITNILRFEIKNQMKVRGESGNGAKFWPDGSAFKACVAGVHMDKICHFGLFFFGSFLLEEQKK